MTQQLEFAVNLRSVVHLHRWKFQHNAYVGVGSFFFFKEKTLHLVFKCYVLLGLELEFFVFFFLMIVLMFCLTTLKSSGLCLTAPNNRDFAPFCSCHQVLPQQFTLDLFDSLYYNVAFSLILFI